MVEITDCHPRIKALQWFSIVFELKDTPAITAHHELGGLALTHLPCFTLVHPPPVTLTFCSSLALAVLPSFVRPLSFLFL